MDLSTYGPAGAAVLTALSVVGGVLFKRSQDRRDAKEKEAARLSGERSAADAAANVRAQNVYDQMQETLDANRAELRAVQADLAKLRLEAEDQWSKMKQMRRMIDEYEAHFAAWNRWADAGCKGERPHMVTP